MPRPHGIISDRNILITLPAIIRFICFNQYRHYDHSPSRPRSMATSAGEYFNSVWHEHYDMVIALLILITLFGLCISLCLCLRCCCTGQATQNQAKIDIEKTSDSPKALSIHMPESKHPTPVGVLPSPLFFRLHQYPPSLDMDERRVVKEACHRYDARGNTQRDGSSTPQQISQCTAYEKVQSREIGPPGEHPANEPPSYEEPMIVASGRTGFYTQEQILRI